MKKFLCYDTNDAASGKINVDNRGMLKPNSTIPSTNGATNQQLVIGRDGSIKWEDRLAYEDSKLVVPYFGNTRFVKVADEAPSWASVDVPMKVWFSNGNNHMVITEDYKDLGNGSFVVEELVLFITTDNVKIGGLVFPEKGVYFVYTPEQYISGIASADSDIPEITWDGNIEVIKKLDKKFIPSELNEVVLPSSTPSSSKKFKITVDDTGAISATEV